MRLHLRKWHRVRAAAALVLLVTLFLTAVGLARPAVMMGVGYLDRIWFAQEQLPPLYLLYSGYVLLCATGVAFCLPVAAVLTAIGGALFGFVGFPLALAGITAGSVPPFLVSRKFGGPALAKVDAGVVERFRGGFARYGAQFLILMRLLPWAPFSVTTIIAGALDMPLANFLLATALGFVPAGVALNAIGHGAARISDFQKFSATAFLRQPEFLLLLAGIGGLAILDIFRRRLHRRRLLD